MANDSDITFTIGLNTSPAEKDIAEFQKLLKHNDKINTLNTLRSNASSSYSSLMNAGKWVRSGDAYEVKDYERMLRQQASRIRGLDRTLRQSFTISPREFTLKGDSYYNMPPAVIGSAQTAYNNYAFRRDAFNNMMGRAGQNVLALPAPKTTLEDIELNEFANRLNGNGGRNEFEERNLQKLSLLNERRKASFDFTQAESDEERNDAIKRYTNADQALKALNQKEKKIKEVKKEIAKEEKNNANDLNPFEDRNRAYLNLLKQRKDAKKKYDESGDIDALKEYTSADQHLKALKDQEKEKKNNAKEEKNNANDLNPFEDRNRAYLNLLKQRKDAKKKYDEIGDIDALKKYTSADQQLKALKDQEKEKKNNAKEEKGSLIRFGKMLATLHLIKKVLNSIKDIWKRLSDTELKVTQRDVKEKGIFSVDAYSAMHANVDRSHSVISRGLGYMGAAAPFSMDAFDSVLKQLQDLNLKAISGQGIADEQLVISLQRLSDSLGMGFNIKDILTDPNLNLTDFLTNLMNSVEKFLPKLNSLDDIKKSLVTNDIIKALGPELANALVYNYNYNQRTGGTSTVMEQVTSKGTNAYGLIDYTKEAKKFTDALASSRAALDEFKTALGGVFAPIVKVVLDKVEEKAAEGTMLINSIKSDNSGLNNVLLYTGSYILDKNQKKDKTELNKWYDKEENKKISKEKFDDAKQLDSFNRILNFAFYNPTALTAGTSSVGLEEIVRKGKASVIEQMINGKKFSQLDKGKFTDEEWTVIKDIYDNINIGNEDLAYQKDVVDIQNLKSFKKLFEQGGLYDFDPNKNTPPLYVENILGKKLYHAILIKLLSEENNFMQKQGIMKENGFSYYTNDEYDKQGNKISGTVVLRLQLTDGTYRDIPTTFEEGMVNAIVDVPSLQ